jgi:Rad3-related DNA helicase
VIALLDTRLRSKGYGRTILTSLPKMSVTETLDDVASFFGETKEASFL